MADGWCRLALGTALVSAAANGWQRLAFNERAQVGGSDTSGAVMGLAAVRESKSRAQVRGADGLHAAELSA